MPQPVRSGPTATTARRRTAHRPALRQTPPGTKTITIIDGSSGKRQEVVIPADGKAHHRDRRARFAEASRHGPLPRVADDGTRPADAFARPVKPIPGKPNAPRIAIVVGGLGIGASGTNDAISKLPGAVTLAFASYGADLDRRSRARAPAGMS